LWEEDRVRQTASLTDSSVFRSLRFGFLAAVVVCCAPAVVFGYEYRVPILIEDEDDLVELRESEEISYDEYDRLLRLFRNPLDLNSASRDELYDLPGLSYALADRIIAARREKPFGRVSDVDKVDGITDDIYVQMKAFVRVVKRREVKKKGKLRGELRAKVVDRVSPTDHNYPEFYVRYKLERPGVFQTGMLYSHRNVAYWPEFKSNEYGDDLYLWKYNTDWSAKYDKDEFEKSGTRVHSVDKHDEHYLLSERGPIYMTAWPKAYGMWTFDKVKFIVGSYNVGFGQRLVFDNTGRTNPHGLMPDISVYEGETGLSPAKGLFGAAATVAPTDWFDFTLFGSWWRYDITQSDLKHLVKAEFDGDEDEYQGYTLLTSYDPDRESPWGNPDYYCDGNCFRKYSYQTLPEAFTEIAAGANTRFSFLNKSHVGLTGYLGYLDFHLGDEDTSFSSSATYPQRDLFYSAGLDFALGLPAISVFGEAAIMDNLGFAGLLRAVWEAGDFTLEPIYRYYSNDWDNPHARGKAQSDQLLGNNDRGEQGFLLVSRYRPARWISLRLDADIWQAAVWEDSNVKESLEYPWRMDLYLKMDFLPVDKLRIGAFVEYTDRDITEGGFTEEYYSSKEPPQGERYSAGIQFATHLIPETRIWLYYKASFMGAGPENDDGTGDGLMDMEHYVYLKVRFTPFGFKGTKSKRWLVLDARVKYLDGEVMDDAGSSSERFMEEWVQLATTLGKTRKYTIMLRGATRQHFEKENADGETTKKATEWFWKAMLAYKF